VSFDHGSAGGAVWVGLKVFHLSHQEQHFEKLVDVFALDGANRHHHHISTPFFSEEILLRELLLHPVCRGTFFVDLVDGYNNRHLCGPGVADRLKRLRTHTVVGGDDQDGNVGDFRPPRTHRGECGVARGVEEGELPCLVFVLDFNLVSTDVLGDSTGFSSSHPCLSDRIEKARLAMVDVAHDGHHRRATNQVFEIRLFDHFDGLLRRLLDIVLKHRNIEFLCHRFDGGHIQGLRHRGDNPFEEQGFDDF